MPCKISRSCSTRSYNQTTQAPWDDHHPQLKQHTEIIEISVLSLLGLLSTLQVQADGTHCCPNAECKAWCGVDSRNQAHVESRKPLPCTQLLQSSELERDWRLHVTKTLSQMASRSLFDFEADGHRALLAHPCSLSPKPSTLGIQSFEGGPPCFQFAHRARNESGRRAQTSQLRPAVPPHKLPRRVPPCLTHAAWTTTPEEKALLSTLLRPIHVAQARPCRTA